MREAEFQFRVQGHGDARPAAASGASTALDAAPAAVVAAASAPAPVPAAPAAPEPAPEPPGHVVKSPIVGTFYAAPSPEAESYVRVGDRVQKGQVVCIIEAMKLMNEIESDVSGVVQKIYPENAQPVEFGEPLFSVKTD